ncbi:MAG: class I SAM-dependent rRNA methyltransferase [Scytonematopsis contorta HA4267-MV1]|jgi:23S rRNA (cytosine1962-C5)-methyltransferase|nr:class I SAM-dependent rRNA methyltransferase [Scytonematopsis contorta HA4267-MV1]
MHDFPKITLYSIKAEAVKRFHPWIFSGAIKNAPSDLKDGEIVEVYTEGGDFLATGHYSRTNIAVKIFSFRKIKDLSKFFLEKLQQAYSLRQNLSLVNSETTNCYRLIATEGDGMPGLIIDWYNGTAVLQASSIGMYQQQDLIVECLQEIYGDKLQAVYDKSASVLPKSLIQTENKYLLGTRGDGEVLEYGHRFFVDWEEGQKTGLFLDQKDNRQRLAKYVSGKRVLNTFCYSGGFSVYAAKAGAELIHSVDSSAKAIEWAKHNVALNNPQDVPHETFVGDVFDFFKESASYDAIVLDPPAFAKTQSARHSAVMAYKSLNKQAFAKVRPGGVVFTFSCSQVVGVEQFHGAVTAAAIESKRQVRVLEYLTQAGDHPTSIFHPEGRYLKGLVLSVD